MTSPPLTRRSRKPSEEGFMLLAVICLLALMMIALSVAIPRIAADIQRDRELETMHRGKQYTRAIQLYYRKFRRYPPNIDALVKTNEIRFLRKKYVDPTTGKEEWKPIMLGMNKTPMAMGFFGQPLGGTGGAVLGSTGPGGGNGVAGGGAGGPSWLGSSSSIGATSGTASTDTTGTGASTIGTGASTTGSGGADANGTTATNGPLSGGQTFGGAGIAGVSPTSPKQSILVYKKKNHYIDWEFLYSPLSDQQSMAGGAVNGGPPLQNGAPSAPVQSPVGGGISSGGITPTPTPTPTPQQ
jgi:type II secretory pathway pseudopilin PulG